MKQTMRDFKRFNPMIIILVVLAALFTGCSGKNSEKGDSSSTGFEDTMFIEDVILAQKDDRWLLINKQGEELANYNSIDPTYSEGLLMVGENDKYGFIDLTGKVVVALQYDYVMPFTEGLAPVYVNEQWGFIDKNNKMTIMPAYDEVSGFMSGLSAVCKDDVYTYINKEGEQAFEGEFISADAFIQGSAVVETEAGMALINTKGEVISDTNFDEISYEDTLTSLVDYGLAMITIDDNYGYINLKTGEILLYPMYSEVTGYRDGLCAICQDGVWGLADETGKVVVAPAYDQIQIIEGGKAVAYTNDTTDYFDKTGKKIDSAEAVGDQLSVKQLEDYSGFQVLNPAGDVLFEDKAVGLIPLNNNEYAYSYYNEEKSTDTELVLSVAIIDNKGKTIVELKDEFLSGDYVWITNVSDKEYAIRASDNTWSLYDSKGNKIASDITFISRDEDDSYALIIKNQLNYLDMNPYSPFNDRANQVNYTDDGYVLTGFSTEDMENYMDTTSYEDEEEYEEEDEYVEDEEYTEDEDADVEVEEDETTDIVENEPPKIGVGIVDIEGKVIMPEVYDNLVPLMNADQLIDLLQNGK